MSQAHAVTCMQCGAAMTLRREGRARCVYCLSEQPLPLDVALPLQESHALSTALDDLSRRRRSLWENEMAAVAVVACIGLLCAVSGVWFALLNYGIPLSLGLVTLCVGHVGRSRALRKRLAILPFAATHIVEAHLHAGCPHCGALLTVGGGGITATCGYCRTEAILPRPMVRKHLADLHRRVLILAARRRAVVEAEEAGERAVRMAIHIPGAALLYVLFLAFLALFACQIFAPELVMRLFEMLRR